MWEVKLYRNKITGEYKRRIVDSVTGEEKPKKVRDSEITVDNVEDAFDYAVAELGKDTVLEFIKINCNAENLRTFLVNLYKDSDLKFGGDEE